MILINSSSRNSLRIFQPFLPIFVPVGIGHLVSIAEREGIKIRFIDEQVENNILGKVAKYVKEMEKPYIFGFSVLTLGFNRSLIVSRELKRLYPDSVIVFGGIHPTALPEEVLSHNHIDIVVRGEAERIFLDLYRCIKAKNDFSHLDNISYKKNGLIVHNKRGPIIDDLDSLPIFPYHIFTSKLYDLGVIVSSRGCPYDCIFCSNRITTGKKYRFRSTSIIIDELLILHNQYNRRNIDFLDDNFLVNKERVYSLIENIRRKDLHKKIIFNFQARGDNVDSKLLKELFNSGFKNIFFGLETSSDKIMKIIKKNETVAECVEAIRLAKKIGFHVSGTFMYSLPQETHQDRMDCLKLTNELDLDFVRFNNATPYPGTELYEISKREGRLIIDGIYNNFISVGAFIENPFRRIPLAYVPEGNSEGEIKRDILYSYFSFYLNLNRIKSIFSRSDTIESWFVLGESPMEIFKKIPALVTLGFMFFCKFLQLFYYTVVKKDTAISFKYFLKIFAGGSKS